jgi:hypothetical protein
MTTFASEGVKVKSQGRSNTIEEVKLTNGLLGIGYATSL